MNFKFNIHIIKDMGHLDKHSWRLWGHYLGRQAGSAWESACPFQLYQANSVFHSLFPSSPLEPQIFPSSFDFSVPVFLHYQDSGYIGLGNGTYGSLVKSGRYLQVRHCLYTYHSLTNS